MATTVPVDGAELRKRRIEAGMSGVDLATAVGVTPEWVYMIERAGDRPRRVSPRVYRAFLETLRAAPWTALRYDTDERAA